VWAWKHLKLPGNGRSSVVERGGDRADWSRPKLEKIARLGFLSFVYPCSTFSLFKIHKCVYSGAASRSTLCRERVRGTHLPHYVCEMLA
jgi:hypothetical protein